VPTREAAHDAEDRHDDADDAERDLEASLAVAADLTDLVEAREESHDYGRLSRLSDGPLLLHAKSLYRFVSPYRSAIIARRRY
jgi:hypothetical protein